jgi:hypothetical protein
MQTISLERVSPEVFDDPHDAGPITRLHLRVEAWFMRAGFERKSRGELVCRWFH